METHMKSLLYAVAALPLLTGVALATEPVTQEPLKQPVRLTSLQMDKVTAGFRFTELTVSNTSAVLVTVDVVPPALPGAFLRVLSPNLSVQAAFLP
jgi:hypothetical protein